MVITRNQDWRIAQKQRKKSRDVHTALSRFHGEKNGKMLYTRSDKVVRAAQLGMAYPRMTNPLRAKRGQEEYQLANECSFICSRNQWRSPTAEQVFRRYPSLTVRSAGTRRNAKKTVSHDLLHWADVICVMEQQHKNRLIAEYRRIIERKPLHVLDIPDDYRYMDPELIALLEAVVPERLGINDH